jgi:hypothetical protein
MANQDAAFGFRAVRHLSGGTPRTEEYLIASGLTKVIYTGSPVMAVSTGVITLGTVSAVQHLGVFNGCFYTDPTTSKPTWKAYYPGSITASDIVANVYADPQIIFEGQHDGTATVANNNHANHDHVGTGGSTINGQSSAEIDSSTYTTTGAGTFVQIGTSKDPENSDLTAANSNAYVVSNTGEHKYNLITGL